MIDGRNRVLQSPGSNMHSPEPRRVLSQKQDCPAVITDKTTITKGEDPIKGREKGLKSIRCHILKKKEKKYPDLWKVRLQKDIDEALKNHDSPCEERDKDILTAFAYHARTSQDMLPYRHLLRSEDTKISFTCPPTGELNFKKLGEHIDRYSVIYADILALCEKLPRNEFYRWSKSEFSEKNLADGEIDYGEVQGRNYDNAVFVSGDKSSSAEYGDRLETYYLDPDTRLLNINTASPYYKGFNNILKKHNLEKSQFVFTTSMAVKAGVQMIYDDTLISSGNSNDRYPWYKILDLNVIQKVV